MLGGASNKVTFLYRFYETLFSVLILVHFEFLLCVSL